MKKSICLLFIILNFNALGDYCWVQKANVSSFNRYAAMGFEINGKGYLGCGYSNGNGNSDFWEYDPISNSWTQKANYPGGNIWAGSGFSIGNKGYFALGTNGVVFIGTLHEYDPVLNAWTLKAPFPALARQDCFGFSANNFGYIVGGWRSGNYFNDLHKYDPVSNTWTAQSNFTGTPRSGLRGFVIGTTAYCGTGWIGGSALSDMAAYNTLTNTWTGIAPLPGPTRNSGSSFTMNGKGFMGNGYDNLFYNDFYEYDPALNVWTQIPSFPGQTKTYTVSFTLGGNGYISTGRYGSISSLSNQTWMLTEGPEALFSTNTSGCNSVNFTNSSTNSTSYNWSFGDGTNSTSSSPNHTYTNSGNYTVTLIANNGSCSDTLTQIVSVTGNVIANFNASVSNCSSTILIQNNSTNASSYTWQWGNGQQSSGPQTSYTYSIPGVYTITLIASDGNCTDTVTQNINIPQALNANLNLSTDCNNNVFINNFTSNGNSFIWLWGDGQQTLGNAISHNYSSSGNYTISLILSNSTCTDTLTYPITISATPVSVFTYTNNCDYSINLFNTSLNSTQFEWQWGNGNQSTGNVSTYTYSNSGVYNITLIAMNGNCSDTTVQQITIPDTLYANLTLTNDCNNNVLVNNFTSNATSINWLWGDGQQSTGIVTSHAYSNDGSYNISIILSNSNCDDTLQYTIDAYSTPNASFTANANCDLSVNLNNTSSANSSQFEWNWGNGTNTTGNPSSYLYSLAGPYIITLIAKNGPCSDTTTQSVILTPIVNSQFNVTPDCNLGVTLQNNSSNALAYQWIWGDGTNNSTNPSYYQYDTSGNYLISLIAYNGICTDTSTYTVMVDTFPNSAIIYSYNNCHDTLLLTSQFNSSSYLWILGDGNTSNLNSINHNYSQPGIYTVSLINTNSYCSDTADVTLTLPGTVTAAFTSSISCDGFLSAQPLINNNNWQYNWTLGDGTTMSSPTISHQYQNPSIYQLSLITNNGYCIDSTSASIEYPLAVIHEIKTVIDSCEKNVSFTISPTPNTPVIWTFGDGTTSTSNNPSHKYEQPLLYNCQVIIDPLSICADTVNIQLDFSNALIANELFIPNSFSPNNDLINDVFEIQKQVCGFEEAFIFNRWGFQVYHSTNSKFTWDGTYKDEPLPEGIYVLLIKFKNGSHQSTLTILR